jgi:hypothetical protein
MCGDDCPTPAQLADALTAEVTAAAYRAAADWLTAEYPGPHADRAVRLAAARLRARADQMGQQ